MATNVFSIPVFLVVLRETLEAAVVVSVLLAFLKQTLGHPESDVAVYNRFLKQVWLGAALGFLLCLIIGGAVIGVFYRFGSNVWENAEYIYEGVLYLIAGLIVTVVGVALLRVGKMQEKWRVKLARSLNAPMKADNTQGRLRRLTAKYAFFVVTFLTVSREGIEGVVFVSGVSFSTPATSIPLPVVVGLLTGIALGWMLYMGGSNAKLQVFLVASTCLLYLVAAGLIARAVWYFEAQHWKQIVGGDAAELGDGPGSYDIDRSVWHVNCCSPEIDGGYGWGVFNGILGWTNSATYSTVVVYNVYWILVMAAIFALRYSEVHGHWPLMKRKESQSSSPALSQEQSNDENGGK